MIRPPLQTCGQTIGGCPVGPLGPVGVGLGPLGPVDGVGDPGVVVGGLVRDGVGMGGIGSPGPVEGEGGTGGGGSVRSASTEMISAVVAIASTSANAAENVHIPTDRSQRGHGSGQMRQRPSRPFLYQWGRKSGPFLVPIASRSVSVIASIRLLATVAPAAYDSALTATQGAKSVLFSYSMTWSDLR